MCIVQLSAIAEEFQENVKGVSNGDGIGEIYFASMQELYRKYIDPDVALLEINIASRLRKKIQAVFTEKSNVVDMKGIMLLMKSAAVEIQKLMTEAAIRWTILEQSELRKSSRARCQSVTNEKR